MIYHDVLEAVGNTPLIRLNRMTDPEDAEVLVKFEAVNIGGSVKTRTALNMIQAAEKDGRIGPDTIIVEPTSGNQGIGLALIGAVKGYKTRIIMPDSVSEERRKLVKNYGAEVVLIHDEGNIGACIEKCMQTALQMAKDDPNVFVPQQFENEANSQAHREQTGQEILKQAGKPIHGFCSGIGTGGTITGVGEYLKSQNPNVKVVAVEPASSPVLSKGTAGAHKIQGIGAGFVPDVLDTKVYDEIIPVANEDAFAAGKEVGRSEGVLVGISAGAALWAAIELAKRPENKGKTIVALLPDTGDRYLSTPLFEE